MIYYESPQAKVYWNDTFKAIVLEWKSFAQGEAFRTPIIKGLELLGLKKSVIWIADTRKLSAMNQEDQDWIPEYWHPRAINAGVKYLITITPQKMVASSGLKRIISNLNNMEGGYASVEFSSLDEAIEWLSEVNLNV